MFLNSHVHGLYLPWDRPYYTPSPFYETLKLKKEEIMSFLHHLEMENIEARQKFEEYKKEINFYRYAWFRESTRCVINDSAFLDSGLASLQVWFYPFCFFSISVPWDFWHQFSKSIKDSLLHYSYKHCTGILRSLSIED